MEKLKISIVTPSYNQGQFIEETILSVLNQNYENLEYIIIDGASTDNSVEIIKKYEDRLAYWISEKDRGQTDAINKGFKKCTGEIIAWINSDDVYCESSLKVIAEYFTQNTEDRVVVGNGLFMNSEGKPYIRKYPNISSWLGKNCMMSIFQPSTFLRRSVLTEVGFLNEDYEMMMDAEWFYRINRKFPFCVIDKDLSIFRWHPDSKSSAKHSSKLYKKYKNEHISIIRSSAPDYIKFIDAFPKASFYIHIWIGNTARYLRRFFRGELYKLKDNDI